MARDKPTRIFDPGIPFEHRLSQIAYLGCQSNSESKHNTLPEKQMRQPEAGAQDRGAHTANDTTDSTFPGLARADRGCHFVLPQAFANVHGD